MPCSRRLFVVAFVLALSHAISADSVRVLADTAVHVRPDADSEVLSVLKAGTILEVAARQGDWYPVLLPPDGRGLRRYGFVAAVAVQPDLEPADAPARVTVRRGESVAVLIDVAIAEHVTEKVSRIDLARNRALCEALDQRTGDRLRRKGLQTGATGLGSVGLYFEKSAVLRVVRNAEGSVGGPPLYDDTAWDFDEHEYQLQAGVPEPGAAAAQEAAPPFWLSPGLLAAPDLMAQMRDLYRGLDAIDRLHPMGMRRSRGWQRTVPGAGGLSGLVSGDLAIVVLVRGRERPSPAAFPRFFRDAFVNARYEVSGALVSVFLVHGGYGRVVAWDSRIEGTTTSAKLRDVVGELVDDVVERSLGG